MLRLDHLTILVGSIEGSRSFYETLLPLLGFSRTTRENWTDGKGFFFQFLEAREGSRPYERHGAGLNHMGFGAPDMATVERIRDEMAKAGHEAQIQHLGGAECLFLKDPDGMRVEISWYPPGVDVVD